MYNKITFEIFGDCSAHIALSNSKHTKAFGMCNWVALLSEKSPNFLRIDDDFLNKKNVSNYIKKIINIDANKSVLEYLFNNNFEADYFLLDCMDCRKEILIDKTVATFSCITYIRNIIDPTELFSESSQYAIIPSYKIPLSQYLNAADIFIEKILETYPQNRIIINIHRPTNVYYDENGCQQSPSFTAKHLNKFAMELVNKIEDYVINKLPNANIIPFPEFVNLNPNHTLGKSPLHYDESYYNYYRKCINIITSQNNGILKTSEILEYYKLLCSLQFQNYRISNELNYFKLIVNNRIDNLIERLDCINNDQFLLEKFKQTSDIYEYLDLLFIYKNCISIALSIKGTPGLYSQKDIVTKLQSLGFKSFTNKKNFSYVGLIVNCVVISDSASDNSKTEICVSKLIDKLSVQLSSSSLSNKSNSSILINKSQYSLNNRGLNFVIFNHKSGLVYDSASFDSLESFRVTHNL